jgi:hypothetical protein
MKSGIVEIPISILASVETLDELDDWLTTQQSEVMSELREARQEDLAGEFRAWNPRHLSCPEGA